ncbi:membrane protein [Mesobacillus campisalis]|uniref:Membrane protein n=1 Tax=Mesobacillus campisalis TaxID=1408103 RepID=A0A0M2SEC2_9BACI|nr:DUF421 domain-containing protein [Mesobacillus campisalis]KKK33089.1 membrane protein [Mesobacillus campisalis]
MEEYGAIILRTLLLYIIIIITFRVMGKREIGELSLLDLVVFIMIAEMAAMAIENFNDPLIKSLLPMMLLVGIQFVFALASLKSKRFREIIDGKPSIVINNGKIDEGEMRRQRYNFDDMLLQLREEGVGDIADVEYAILEPSGKMSVFKKSASEKLSLPLILDGTINEENLILIGKTNDWLQGQLEKQGYSTVGEISYCSYKNGKLFVDIKDEK